MSTVGLPQAFSRRVVGAFGVPGADWLRRLPSILDDISSRWSIALGDPFADMQYNYVAPAVRDDGAEAVLKIGVLRRELTAEIAALRAFNGCGAVQLLDAEPELGALLLERLRPGEAVLHLEDDEAATRSALRVMRRLWTSGLPEDGFPTVAEWAQGLRRLRDRFDGKTGPFPRSLVERAEASFRELLASMSEPTLLHGDLHHWNILSAEREPWLAIDPKGVIGEPAYEVGAWLRNPFPDILSLPNPVSLLARRVDQFVEGTGFVRDRIVAWAFAQTVLSAWWSFEDSDGDWKDWLTCAELFTKPGR
jgi:streptomycin 6-kinase